MKVGEFVKGTVISIDPIEQGQKFELVIRQEDGTLTSIYVPSPRPPRRPR